VFTRSAALYDPLYATFKDYSREAERLRELIAERAPEARTLLDVACGTGKHLELLRPHFEVVGLDLDPELLAIARERVPEVELHEEDMTDFDLGRRFDVVTCLFSSIGYVLTRERLHEAVAVMARHLEPGGVLFVEPWLRPDAWQEGHISMLVVDEPQRKIVRVSRPIRRGDVSVVEFDYLVGTPERVTHFVERHELGLFSDGDYRSAFEAAGLTVDYDAEGLMGRGLYMGAA
jgi:dTDP-3-amino-3,4,6-trideoxy-alpha-D-glucopyranose N,N-dimethyltransferase